MLVVCFSLFCLVDFPNVHSAPIATTPPLPSPSSSDGKLAISCLSGNCQHDTMSVIVGGKIHFHCLTAEGHDVSEQVFWFHNGTNMLNRPCSTNSITLQEPCIMLGTHFETLVINSLSTSDAGNYKCCYANCVNSSQDISVTLLQTLVITEPILPEKQLSLAPTTSTNTMRSTSAINTRAPLATESSYPTFSASMKGTEVSTRFQSVTAGIMSQPMETTMVDPEATMYFSPTKFVVDEGVIASNKESGGNLDEKVSAIAGAFVGGFVIVVIICVLVFTNRCRQPPQGNSSEEPLSQPSNSHNITSNEDRPQHDAPVLPCKDSLVRAHDLQDMEKRIRGDISQTRNQLSKQVKEVGDELAERGNQQGDTNNASIVHTSSSRTETVL
ncbi:uncharacterized protein LOC134176681 isoform X2 [Corticium candelabrum]|uniref:uncharacterized protein LOC134176681 isoform X2 n=1 Tax=Corticium candelabrum TaxID=121492 RepID=UPI002E25E6D7|nr:uncharacterized protein LOC134176681 isoform X2 [Corticium candelabrum]